MNIELLAEICKTPGAPGFEQRVRELVMREVEGLVDEMYTDNLGNVYAVKKGKSDQKVMIAAHMDEIGFMVKGIDDQGFIRFHTLGGFDPKTHTAQRVIIHGKEDVIGVMASKPYHIMKADERNKAPKNEDYFIDTGLSKKEVDKLISIGDPVTRQRVCLPFKKRSESAEQMFQH
jgi:tetrahedral aminopeptidase